MNNKNNQTEGARLMMTDKEEPSKPVVEMETGLAADVEEATVPVADADVGGVEETKGTGAGAADVADVADVADAGGVEETKGPAADEATTALSLPPPMAPPNIFGFVFGVVADHFALPSALQAAIIRCMRANAQIIALSECAPDSIAIVALIPAVREGVFNMTVLGNFILLVRNAPTKVWKCTNVSTDCISKAITLVKLRFVHADNPEAVQHLLWSCIDRFVLMRDKMKTIDIAPLTKRIVGEVQLFQRDTLPCCVISIPPDMLQSSIQQLGMSVHTTSGEAFGAIFTGIDRSQDAMLLKIPPTPWKCLMLPLKHMV